MTAPPWGGGGSVPLDGIVSSEEPDADSALEAMEVGESSPGLDRLDIHWHADVTAPDGSQYSWEDIQGQTAAERELSFLEWLNEVGYREDTWSDIEVWADEAYSYEG